MQAPEAVRDPPPPRPALAGIAERLIGDLGIVRLAGPANRQAGAPAFFHFWAQAADTGTFVRQRNFAKTGGAATDRDRALAKALGEAVERYCAAIYDREELLLRTAEAAEFAVADPADFALNSTSQYAEPGFRFVPFDSQTPVRWTPATDAVTGAVVSVPAAMVYVPYFYAPGSGDSPIAQPISTGLACHESFEQAAIGALNEVIERDAFTITWQAALAPARLDLTTLPDDLSGLVERFRRARYSVTLFDITLDSGVPTILAVSRHPSEECPAVVVAASSSLDPAHAVRGSLEELAHTGHYCQAITTHVPRLEVSDGASAVIDQRSHLNYWCDHANAAQIDFLFASPVCRAYSDLPVAVSGSPAGDLAQLASRVAATGHRPFLCDLTTPDVAGAGLSVVRAVVPGYHPLVSGHRYRALGGRRLWEVPQRLGFRGTSPALGDNPRPHPYP